MKTSDDVVFRMQILSFHLALLRLKLENCLETAEIGKSTKSPPFAVFLQHPS